MYAKNLQNYKLLNHLLYKKETSFEYKAVYFSLSKLNQYLYLGKSIIRKVCMT